MRSTLLVSIFVAVFIVSLQANNASADYWTYEVQGTLDEGGGYTSGPFVDARLGDTVILKFTVNTLTHSITDDWEETPHASRYVPLADFSIEINGIVDHMALGAQTGKIQMFNDYWVVDSIWASGASASGHSAVSEITKDDTEWFENFYIEDSEGSYTIWQDFTLTVHKSQIFGPGGMFYFRPVAVSTYFTASAGYCPVDWNRDGQVSETDYLVGTPPGGFYAEWFISLYYPSYYPVLFPAGDLSLLDFNGDGVTDDDDLMGTLDPVYATEGYYSAWYIYMYYPGYVPVFMPEYQCTYIR